MELTEIWQHDFISQLQAHFPYESTWNVCKKVWRYQTHMMGRYNIAIPHISHRLS